MRLFGLMTILFLLAGCVSKPVLVPNQKYQNAGHVRSEKDIASCEEVAKAQIRKTESKREARNLGRIILLGRPYSTENARRGLVDHCLKRKGYQIAGWD